ncbi:MAG: substrate-binding domain-containing protein [Chloroflexi bacterium]|nr:substrate-binding domain-containing protein [Chloroflexota bacterium]
MRKATCFLLSLLTILSILAAIAGCSNAGAEEPLTPKERVRVATTTSLYDTGLWGYLEPMFEKKYKVELDVLYAGTGIAFEYGKRGDVDVITIHDKAREEQFISEGYGVKRVPFAYNYFIIVGPASDPAGIKSMSPEDALRKLQSMKSVPFISRGDDSGTHAKEKSLWKSAGFDYAVIRKAGAWYIEAGSGMGPTLLMASEKQGYTLTDVGTFLAYKGKLNLTPIVEKGSALLNVYSVIAINPQKTSGVKATMANNMVDFLTSPEILGVIGKYGTGKYGSPLFYPITGTEPTS